jgi:hypothetical protein
MVEEGQCGQQQIKIVARSVRGNAAVHGAVSFTSSGVEQLVLGGAVDKNTSTISSFPQSKFLQTDLAY